ncbi:hypothetical protein H0H87_009446 [Tephrocybe sp. NHM501043]|nr:hypothetical protein H0H87_009446 [Tephrocybe sp. NHM501043]
MSYPGEAKELESKKNSDNSPTYLEEQEITQTGIREPQWIAIEPPNNRHSQFDIILRRQRLRPKDGGGRKLTTLPSRFLHLANEFEFAGWGSMTRLNLSEDDRKAGETRLQEIRRQSVLGQFTASALAGNAVLGSVFYALPAVVAVSTV